MAWHSKLVDEAVARQRSLEVHRANEQEAGMSEKDRHNLAVETVRYLLKCKRLNERERRDVRYLLEAV